MFEKHSVHDMFHSPLQHLIVWLHSLCGTVFCCVHHLATTKVGSLQE